MGQFTNGTISENTGSFIFPVDQDLTEDDIRQFVDYHRNSLADKFRDKLNEYKGIKPSKYKENKSLSSKNHLIVNMPKYLVDTLNGFFVGIAPTIKLSDKGLNDKFQSWLNENSFVDDLNEIAKQTSIYGRSYVLVYQDEESKTNVAVVRPNEGFMIYDDTIKHKPIAFVRYGKNNEDDIVGTIYNTSTYQEFKIDGDLIIENEKPLVYKGNVPAVEFFDNAERTSVTDGVETLIKELNKLLSQKADDIDYFADAYLSVIGPQLDEKTIGNIRQNRIINLYQGDLSNIKVNFLEKPNADEAQEHMIDRTTNLIFQISMIANINDEIFGNATSGRSLEYKLLSMRNLTSNKERKFTKQLRALFKIVGSIQNFGSENLGNDVQFTFVRNLPNNNAEEAETAVNLSGIVSKETQLSTLSIVKDPDDEIKKIRAEAKQDAKDARKNNGLNYDFENGDNDTQDDKKGDTAQEKDK